MAVRPHKTTSLTFGRGVQTPCSAEPSQVLYPTSVYCLDFSQGLGQGLGLDTPGLLLLVRRFYRLFLAQG